VVVPLNKVESESKIILAPGRENFTSLSEILPRIVCDKFCEKAE
jgi:hypothetical protein